MFIFVSPTWQVKKQEKDEKKSDDEDAKGKKGSKTVVQREEFKELSQNTFKVTIGRVQQLALERAAALKLPTPQEQLSMVQQRRDAKKSREKTANPSLYIL